MAADVVVKFLADTAQLKQGLAQVEGSGQKLQKVAGAVGAAIGGAFVATQVKSWIGAAEDAEQASAKLAKTLKNAGDESGKWAASAEDLAGSLSKQVGIDDEIIKGGQTVLATFHSVSGAAAQQSGVFDRATKAAVDLSATGFGSVESASVMLGKALEDPLKGITALGKAGVTFTAQQKEQIKTLVESGDVLGAQAIVLKNVEAQVGGVAEKSATGSMKMKVAFGELQESLGAALLPAFRQLAEIAGVVASAFTALPGPVQSFVVIAGLAAAAAGLLYSSGVNVVKAVGAIATGVGKAAAEIPYLILRLQLLNATQILTAGAVGLAVVAIAGFVYLMAQGTTAVERATEAGKKWGQTQVENARQAASTEQSLALLVPRMELLKAEYAATETAIAAYGAVTNSAQLASERFGISTAEARARVAELSVSGAELKAKMQELGPEIAKLEKEQRLATYANELAKVEMDKLAAASQGVATANESQRKSIQDVTNAYLAAQGGPLAYAAAQMQVESAQIRANEAIAKYGPDSLEARQATNDLQQAQLAATQSAYNLQTTQADLANILKTNGVSGLQSLRATLLETIRTQGDATGAVAAQITKIDEYIATTAKVPPEKTTKVNADTKKANDDVEEHGRKADHATRDRTTKVTTLSQLGEDYMRFSSGGIVPGPRGSPTMAVVHGGERVVSAAQVAAGRYGTGSSGTGSTYNITVKVEPGVSPAEVGARTVDAIRSYERVAGKAWRTG